MKKKYEVQMKTPIPEVSITDVFSKKRIITYLFILFLPPYGLFRVWSRSSDFRRSEKWVWTMIVLCTLVTFVRLIITG